MADRVLFLYENRADAAALSASSEAGGLGAANLQDVRLGRVARTTAAAAEWWQADFGGAVYIGAVVLLAHNLTVNATARVRLSNNSDMSVPLFDQQDFAWPYIYGWADIGWAMDACGGLPPEFDPADWPSVFLVCLPVAVEARYLRIDLVDPGNPDGYIQAGRLIAGEGWRPSRNFSYGWSLAWEDLSDQVEMESGAVWIDRRERYRVLTLPFEYGSREDAMIAMQDMARRVGHSRDVLVLPFPEDDANRQRTTIYGVPFKGGLSAVKQEARNKYSFSIKLRELTA